MSKETTETVSYVSVGKCIFTIIGAIIAACVGFIPFAFTDSGLVFTYKTLPVIGDSSIFVSGAAFISSFCSIIPQITPEIYEYIFKGFKFCVYAYFIILAADIILAFFLAIFRINFFRILCRTFSIIAGIIMFSIMLMFLAYIVGVVYFIIETQPDIMQTLKTSGILAALGFVILSGVLIKKQFRWFTLPD